MRFVLLLLPLALLSACGSDDPAGPGADDARIRKLLPADTQVIVRMSSIDDIETLMGEFARMTPFPSPPGLIDAFRETPGRNPAPVDADRPFALALTLPADGITMVGILPVEDAARVASDYAGPGTARGRDGYIAVLERGVYRPGECSLYDALPAGQLTACADVASLMATHGPLVHAQIESMARFVPTLTRGLGDAARSWPAAFARWAREVVDSADRFGVAFSSRAGALDFGLVYRAKEGTPLGRNAGARSGLVELARFAPRSDSMTVLIELSGETVAGWIAAATGGLVPADLLEGLGDEWLVSVGLRESSMAMVLAVRAEHPKLVADRMADSLLRLLPEGGRPGLRHEGERESGDFAIRRLHLVAPPLEDADIADAPTGLRRYMERIAADGVALELAAGPGVLVVTLDPEGRVTEEVLGAEAPPAKLEAAIDALSGTLRFLVHMDTASIARFASYLDGTVPEATDASAIISGTSEGRTWRWRMRAGPGYISAMQRFTRLR